MRRDRVRIRTGLLPLATSAAQPWSLSAIKCRARLNFGGIRMVRRDDYPAGSRPAGFSFHRGGVSAERLATSMLKYTLACMTVATASVQMISNSTFDLRAYIL